MPGGSRRDTGFLFGWEARSREQRNRLESRGNGMSLFTCQGCSQQQRRRMCAEGRPVFVLVLVTCAFVLVLVTCGDRGGWRGLSHVFNQTRFCRAGVGDSQTPSWQGKAASHPLALALRLHTRLCVPKRDSSAPKQSTQRFPGFYQRFVHLEHVPGASPALSPARADVAEMGQSWRLSLTHSAPGHTTWSMRLFSQFRYI